MVVGLDNVLVIIVMGLIVDLMNKIGVDYLMCGVRNVDDFCYEKDIVVMNYYLDD